MADLRERVVALAGSMFARGLTHGSTGNISARDGDGRLIVTPTGSSFGRLEPARLSVLGRDGAHLEGDRPTKELPLHLAFHETMPEDVGAVVHLHSHYSVALSTLPDLDPEDALPPLTPYARMLLGPVRLLPFFRPGDPAMGEAVRALGGRHAAVLLANHGPVVAARSLEAAVDATEELEATARLALELRGRGARLLTREALDDIDRAFPRPLGASRRV